MCALEDTMMNLVKYLFIQISGQKEVTLTMLVPFSRNGDQNPVPFKKINS